MSMLEDALAYRESGLSIFPVPRGEKFAMDEWKKYQTEQATVEQVQQWFSNEDEYNIAIVCGSASRPSGFGGICVVDLDTQYAIDEYWPKYDTLKAMSGYNEEKRDKHTRGGHLYFGIPEGVTVKSWRTADMDIQAEGKIIIAPPSLHASGVQYEWVDPDVPIMELPEEFYKPYSEDGIPESSSKNWITELFSVDGGFTQGRHNDQVFQFALFMSKYNVPVDVTRSIMLYMDSQDNSPQGQKQIASSVLSAYSDVAPDTSFQTQPLDYLLEHEDNWSFGWLIEDWIPEASIGVIGALPQTGKTWFSIDMAFSLATGVPFLGSPVLKTCNVLYIQLEDPIGMTLQRFRTVSAPHRARLGIDKIPGEDNLHVLKYGDFNFGKQETINAVYDFVEQNNIKFVIVDPLVVAADTHNYMVSIGSDLKDSVRNIRDKFGCGFMFVHHVTKNTKQKDTISQEDLWGAVFVTASFEAKIMMQALLPDENKNIRALIVKRFKSTKSDYDNMMLTLDIDSTKGSERYNATLVPYDSEVPQLRHHVVREKILSFLKDETDPVKPAEISDMIGETSAKVFNHLRVLVDANKIERTKEGYSIIKTMPRVTFVQEEDLDPPDYANIMEDDRF